MSTRPMKILSLNSTDPLALGHEHGESLRDQIKEIAEIRIERMCAMSLFKKVSSVLLLAKEHLPILQKFDVDLFLELRGISEASGVSLEKLIVINNYTDMRDIKPKNLDFDELSGCSVIYSPGKIGPILGQTWDIHASAMPYVVLLKMKNLAVFSIAGCLGMTGLNHNGVSVAINNLNSVDAQVGIIWPALVRKILNQKTALDAKDQVLSAPLGSGHNYTIADEHNLYSIETSGLKKKILDKKICENFFHTNHCLDEEMRKTHIIKDDSNTIERYNYLLNNIGLNNNLDLSQTFLALIGVAIKIDKKNPHKPATCGTIVMDIKKRQILSCIGMPDEEMLKWPQNFINL